MKHLHLVCLTYSVILTLPLWQTATAQLSQNYYTTVCPNLEPIVRATVAQKLKESFATAPGTLRLFFHDCFVRGCDASVLLVAPDGDDENHSGADLTLSPDALDTVNKAKALAVDSDPQCSNKVSCADILALAARDVVSLTGGPDYPVELGRRDGRMVAKAIVKHSLPGPGFNLDELNALFARNGLTQTDMIALSGAHTIGVTHCDKFVRRIYRFKQPLPFNPPMNLMFLRRMRQVCPLNCTPSTVAMLDASTPFRFDNAYYKNLQTADGVVSLRSNPVNGPAITRHCQLVCYEPDHV